MVASEDEKIQKENLSPVLSSRSIECMQTVAWPKYFTLILQECLGRTVLYFTDQETQEKIVLGGPTVLRHSSYTSNLFSIIACMCSYP